jgi:hypothetical protein
MISQMSEKTTLNRITFMIIFELLHTAKSHKITIMINLKNYILKYIPIWTVSLVLLFSCAQKSDKQNQVKKATTSDEVSEHEFNVTANFNWFELKDDKPYSLEFEKESGEIIHFEDCEMNNFDFVVQLNESETSEFNKGWGVNYDLKDQWFNITYTNKKQANNFQEAIPLYVIKKVALATTVRKNDTVRAPKEFTIRAKFIEFVLGDTEHIYFEKESGEMIHFEGSLLFDFGIELDIDDPALSSDNQGWVADPEILGKWFTLTYFRREQPMYIDGPMGIASIISKAVLDEEEEEDKKTTILKTPTSFEILEEIDGDLDLDGISEKVIIYDTGKEIDLGTERQICIYKKNKGTWELWKKSVSAILGSEQGGMMGDPFDGISIERNCIVIKHFGGSRQKWNYTHSYSYQNGDFQLIGAKVFSGAPCDYFETFDYNLSNGTIKYEKEVEDCDKGSSEIEKKELIRKLETLPSMDGFSPGSIKMTFPDYKTTVYY